MAVGHQGAPPHRQEPRNETEEELPRLRAKGRGETSSASDPTVLSPPPQPLTPTPPPTQAARPQASDNPASPPGALGPAELPPRRLHSHVPLF